MPLLSEILEANLNKKSRRKTRSSSKNNNKKPNYIDKDKIHAGESSDSTCNISAQCINYIVHGFLHMYV